MDYYYGTPPWLEKDPEAQCEFCLRMLHVEDIRRTGNELTDNYAYNLCEHCIGEFQCEKCGACDAATFLTDDAARICLYCAAERDDWSEMELHAISRAAQIEALGKHCYICRETNFLKLINLWVFDRLPKCGEENICRSCATTLRRGA